jgi:hypothetical protein
VYKKVLGIALAAMSFGETTLAQSGEGVLARCGASAGQGYFFYDEVMNPQGPSWKRDGISNGHILLVKLGQEWDIQFGDSIGAYGFRQDGAEVIPLGSANGLLTVGAFHPNYTEIYTFNLISKEVLWTSHKIGTAITKVAIYRAECDAISGE